jgi:hypothetical protein
MLTSTAPAVRPQVTPCATSSAAGLLAAATPAVPAPAGSSSTTDPTAEAVQHARDVVDVIKRRSTLVDAVEPLSMAGGLAEHPMRTWSALKGMGSELMHGQVSKLAHDAGQFEVTTAHPDGIAGFAYKNALFVTTGIDSLVGGIEIYQGVKAHDKYLCFMGGADLMAAGSACAFGLSGSTAAMGLGIASAATMAALVLARPKEYSHVQKVMAVTDAIATVPTVMLKAGFLPVPAMIADAVVSPAVMLYMNNSWVREHLDKAGAWVAHHLPHPHKPLAQPPSDQASG